jgi:hypothetical protein
MSEMMLHVSAVAIGGRAVLIAGASGHGKSDLALRLIDRGAKLISDDYTIVEAKHGRLWASPPATIAGKIEVRGIGILSFPPPETPVPVGLLVDLDAEPERLPDPATTIVSGQTVPTIALHALEASAPIKLEAALDLFGLPAE